MILKKLREQERSGALQQLQQQAIHRSISHIKNMPPVAGITTVSVRSKRLIDPTVKFTRAVTTDDGKIVVPAGTTINPLDLITLSKTLVFFDGRDPEQREAVRRLVNGPQHIKPILVAGSWFELTNAWKKQVFYDQQGVLSKRFGIRAVPTVIRQQQNQLLLEEIPAKALR